MNQAFSASCIPGAASDFLEDYLGYKLIYTKDGSPTLSKLDNGECMHHSSGAASETWYIYGDVIRNVFQIAQPRGLSVNILNLGLGLGYIELVWGLLLQHTTLTSRLDSFESDSFLKENFANWRVGEKDAVYDLVLHKLISIGLKQIDKITFLEKFKTYSLVFNADILDLKSTQKWEVICFDAFSNKSNEKLWTYEFLNQFIQNYAAPDCVFTTYACTGNLKKALINNNFKLLKRSGFSGKRDSTLAVKGAIYDEAFPNFLA